MYNNRKKIRNNYGRLNKTVKTPVSDNNNNY